MGGIALPDVRATLGRVLTDLPDDESVDLFEAGVLDSMKLIEVVLVLEEDYGVAPGPQFLRADRFSSLSTIVATVNELLDSHRA